MKQFLRIVTTALLLFSAGGAIYGGLKLVMFPDGSTLHLPPALLQHSMFPDYFIPGLFLLIFVGFLGLWTLITVLCGSKLYCLFVMLQGAVLFSWIIIQMLIIQTTSFFHYLLGSIGLVLVLNGYILNQLEASHE
ncbi:hypothetical protein [Mucilaginibacter sp.]|jgi:hypothetical protein|uniref:hypothetical protein n=1 Tax=Mucilaginibacter sp. TaxID=1882438 RepID=UPI002CC5D280|nr:hypothetical protein [Mucilaginibacter sp.]HTI58732.1 hypothetical protein [Mucilaginibacter sp.]